MDRRLGAVLKAFGWNNGAVSRQVPLVSILPKMGILLGFDFWNS